jgi:hypothetical protein
MLSLNMQHVEIYLPCNFEGNPVTHFGVIVLFSSKFLNFSYYPKTAILPLCSINRHGGHDGW